MARAFKVLSGAQSFGYGPSAKLGVLTNYLHQQGVTVDFWGQGIALRYAQICAVEFAPRQAYLSG